MGFVKFEEGPIFFEIIDHKSFDLGFRGLIMRDLIFGGNNYHSAIVTWGKIYWIVVLFPSIVKSRL
jgi:hypothetical protein